ncbi:MAG: SDR family oxidoreductase [Chloroflexi bacterium]|nr:SDR family oxidoreductase [Chloroflexota bacterium]
MKLEGKAALITGAGSGIGRAIARLFAAEGASVLVAELNEETGKAVVGEIEAAGGRASFLRTDTSREEDVKDAIAATVEKHERLDILVNNAGIGGPTHTWDQVIAVNLSGVYYGCLHGVEAMRGQGSGVIVNMASMAGLVGFTVTGLPVAFGSASGTAYIAAKHGVIGLTKQFALGGAPEVRVNCICPGWIETALTQPLTQAQPLLEWALQGTPMGRLGQPEEIAKAALFLASDDSSFMTGAPLIVDGGWTAR